ncbi:helix-turn-helix domain-containing protein [Lactobacillus helveticus]|uniref:helix-turn-helix domain-containing protein n=1 Tax=Lactobacillus helveticus TaxID=1587 RepID=UPI001562783B|nr:helix-turn-helix transcriptional regulator [Lactobacillus helveticus]NRO04104.1 HTH-type transcriptional regulator ImmR [Lactobacillus helveticus]NRO39755.1 HTH-type transcriptional regulator ImmR [Lactobacillus helveticus]
MALSDRIKDARKNKHYTQKQLAELMNVKSTTISGWELGRNEPSIDSLKKLAQKLDVSFDYLAGIDEQSNNGTPLFRNAVRWKDPRRSKRNLCGYCQRIL